MLSFDFYPSQLVGSGNFFGFHNTNNTNNSFLKQIVVHLGAKKTSVKIGSLIVVGHIQHFTNDVQHNIQRINFIYNILFKGNTNKEGPFKVDNPIKKIWAH